jgi:hypothetical protein
MSIKKRRLKTYKIADIIYANKILKNWLIFGCYKPPTQKEIKEEIENFKD